MRSKVLQARVLLSAAAVTGLLYVASPCVALWHMAGAMDRGDVATLEHCVDWTALRSGLKQDIADGLIGPVSTQLASNTLPPFGASFISGIADSIIEHEVTASHLVEMMHQSATDEPMPNPLGLIDHAYFKSPTMFEVTLRDEDDDTHMRVRLELRRWHWQVTRIWVPQDLIERVSQRT